MIDDIKNEASAELAARAVEVRYLRKKRRGAVTVVYAYYAGSVLLSGASLVNSITTAVDATLADAVRDVAMAFACGAAIAVAGRLIQTTWVSEIDQKISAAQRGSRRAERELRPILGVVPPR